MEGWERESGGVTEKREREWREGRERERVEGRKRERDHLVSTGVEEELKSYDVTMF